MIATQLYKHSIEIYTTMDMKLTSTSAPPGFMPLQICKYFCSGEKLLSALKFHKIKKAVTTAII